MAPQEEHRQKYAACVEALGRAELLTLLPKVKRPWHELLAEDEHLNNVPLPLWDVAHGPTLGRIINWWSMKPMRERIPARGVFALNCVAVRAGRYREPGGWSLCNTGCTLKELARQLAEAGQ